jgi:zinc transporter ZupT
MSAALLSLATFFSALTGEMFALKVRDRLHFILSSTAGVLLGVVSIGIVREILRKLPRQVDSCRVESFARNCSR